MIAFFDVDFFDVVDDVVDDDDQDRDQYNFPATADHQHPAVSR
jgi:hypothetical protein